jgi:alginate O-acetyltransferase complex protein AlgI
VLFNSAAFLIFFPVVTTAYFALPHRFRWLLLLAVTITVDYFAGLGLEKFEGQKKRWFLIATILANTGMLAFFKYFNVANENLAARANFIGVNLFLFSSRETPAKRIWLPSRQSPHRKRC